MPADPTWLAVSNPLSRPLYFVGLELLVVAGFVLTLQHAIGHYRKGDRYPLFQWLIVFFYGISMELIAFNFLNNYDHGQFTIQLYHRKLPFYVVCLYPVFLYTGLKVIERWRLGFFSEALLAGFAICLIDVPFDIAGVDARWWSWSASDPNLAVRWLGVPVTSYYWYLLFGAVYAALCRGFRKRIEPRSLLVYLALAPLFGVAVIVLGSICFLPFHGLKALSVRDDYIVLAHFMLCAGVAVWRRPAEPAPVSWPLFAIPIALAAWHLGLVVTLTARGQVAQAPLKLVSVLAASLGLLTLVWPPARRAAAATEFPLAQENP